MEYILSSVLFVSASLNALLAYFLRSQRKRRPKSIEAEELLGDLLQGEAVLRIHRISPTDVLLRSPRL